MLFEWVRRRFLKTITRHGVECSLSRARDKAQIQVNVHAPIKDGTVSALLRFRVTGKKD